MRCSLRNDAGFDEDSQSLGALSLPTFLLVLMVSMDDGRSEDKRKRKQRVCMNSSLTPMALLSTFVGVPADLYHGIINRDFREM